MGPRSKYAQSGWYGKGLARAAILIGTAAVIAAAATGFGIAQNYGYLRASILTGSPGGYYYALGSGLAERAKRGNGNLVVVPTAGSIENVSRLRGGRGHCAEMFALIQDGTPIPADAQIVLLGRLPEPESLMLLGQANKDFR